ncbi:MAG TPA: hypothetical protein VFB06_06820 [Streptosporangiaceae bacterium]|nr:hypothetical protein [Streptosporangiaceae bacterium]
MEVEPVLVQRVLMPGSGRESWTLLGDDGEVVGPPSVISLTWPRSGVRRDAVG